jgi:hypothetical protein
VPPCAPRAACTLSILHEENAGMGGACVERAQTPPSRFTGDTFRNGERRKIAVMDGGLEVEIRFARAAA